MLAVFFFLAATNTLSGWLYVLCALLGGILLLGAVLPGFQVARLSVERPLEFRGHAGLPLALSGRLVNSTGRSRELIVLTEQRPENLGGDAREVVEQLGKHGSVPWSSVVAQPRRGIFAWNDCQVRSAAPLGLFWQQQTLDLPVTVTVYPRVWRLRRCPWLDTVLRSGSAERGRTRVRALATELTRSVRPYRTGDTPRTIHWRTSARRGELMSRESERSETGTGLVLVLDGRCPWTPESFELAVEAAASLFCHVQQAGLPVGLWSGESLLRDRRTVLEYLAGIRPERSGRAEAAEGSTLLRLVGAIDGMVHLECAGATTRIDFARPLAAQLEMLP